LSYADAKKAIDGHLLSDLVLAPEHSASAIEYDVRTLHSIAKQLRAKRFQDGALSLSDSRLSFALDENGLPKDCEQYDYTEANEVVEEVFNKYNVALLKLTTLRSKFMILTSVAVAQRIAVHLPEQALLRRHDTPIERRLVFRLNVLYLSMHSRSFAECLLRARQAPGSGGEHIVLRSYHAIL
jgi:protein SSD1